MIQLKGKPVYGGISKGRIVFFQKNEPMISKHDVDNPQLELNKYEYAKNCAVEELQQLYENFLENLGRKDAEIFLIQQMIINDEDFDNSVKDIIVREKLNADYAVMQTLKNYTKVLGNIDSEYIKGRSADLKDISNRLVKHILHLSEKSFNLSEQAIVCAEDLVPSETAGLDRNMVLGLCTKYGSETSHTSILAKNMNIPAVMGIGRELLESYNGRQAMLDGYSGTLYIEPDERTQKTLYKKEETEAKKREWLKRLMGRKNITLDKKEINVYANISNLSDVESVIENDAGGIGLFRSESLYPDNNLFPDEEQQFYNYRRVLELMKGKRVVIKTFGAGENKKIDYFGLPKEQNPGMGFYSISRSLKNTERFKTQLRALYRASVYGNLSILVPMIIDPYEIRRVKEIIKQVKKELDTKGQPYKNDVKLGIMIDTHAAVMLSDMLAKEVDFFSIGTNDLEQYKTYSERKDSMLDCVLSSNHLALLRMINHVCINGHNAGIHVGMCGELGADCTLTEALLAMGIDEISVNPASVVPLRRKIRTLDLSDKSEILKRYHIQ